MTVPRMGYDCTDFARHPALVDEEPGVEAQVLDPGEGFEPWKARKIMMIA